MRRLLLRRAKGNDESGDIRQLANDGTLRAPAARALVNDRMENEGDQYADQWIQMMRENETKKLPETLRTVIVRLSPEARLLRDTRLSGRVELADYTQDELLEGFAAQDIDMPPFLMQGSWNAQTQKWVRTAAVSHVAGSVVTTMPCKYTYDQKAAQAALFGPIEKQVDRLLQGENLTVVAFGQVGSGKTYTISGPEEGVREFSNVKKTAWGLIPRIVSRLFAEIRSFKSNGVDVDVEASFVEVYQEQWNDLLSGEKNLKVDKKTGALVKPLERRPFKDVPSLMALYAAGSDRRHVARMNLNARSSRGHAVLQIHATVRMGAGLSTVMGGGGGGAMKRATLNIADLAGMETMGVGQPAKGTPSASKERLAESKIISQSLLGLMEAVMHGPPPPQVATPKGKKGDDGPSKLVQLLAPCLTAESRVVMIYTLRSEPDEALVSRDMMTFVTKPSEISVIDVKKATAGEPAADAAAGGGGPSAGSDGAQAAVAANANAKGAKGTKLSFEDARAMIDAAVQSSGGGVPWPHARLMVRGSGGVGKSTTIEALMGKAFEAGKASTVGADLQDVELHEDELEMEGGGSALRPYDGLEDEYACALAAHAAAFGRDDGAAGAATAQKASMLEMLKASIGGVPKGTRPVQRPVGLRRGLTNTRMLKGVAFGGGEASPGARGGGGGGTPAASSVVAATPPPGTLAAAAAGAGGSGTGVGSAGDAAAATAGGALGLSSESPTDAVPLDLLVKYTRGHRQQRLVLKVQDTGGQPIFLSLLELLTTPECTVYLVVFNLKQLQDDVSRPACAPPPGCPPCRAPHRHSFSPLRVCPRLPPPRRAVRIVPQHPERAVDVGLHVCARRARHPRRHAQGRGDGERDESDQGGARGRLPGHLAGAERSAGRRAPTAVRARHRAARLPEDWARRAAARDARLLRRRELKGAEGGRDPA